MAEPQKLWVPESPKNQEVKLECLRIAAGLYADKAAGPAAVGPAAQPAALECAKALYEWVTEGKK